MVICIFHRVMAVPVATPITMHKRRNLLWGKMIRINVDNFTTPPYYTIPADNPYINNPAIRDEIFAIGLAARADWLNHDMWAADVGETAWEEINYHTFATSGGINYGWRCYEGNADFITTGCLPQSNYHFPIFVYPHNNATGGFFCNWRTCLQGQRVCRSVRVLYMRRLCFGNALPIKPNGSGGCTSSCKQVCRFLSLALAKMRAGHYMLLHYPVHCMKSTTNSGVTLPVTLLEFNAKAFAGYNEVKWRTINVEQNILYHEVEFSNDAVSYMNAGRVNALNVLLENYYEVTRHFTLHLTGCSTG